MRSRPVSLLLALLVAVASLSAVTVGTAAPAGAAVTTFAVPTPDAGLGRIVTAPNGDLWFVERDAQKLGRITPSGQVTEIDLYAGSSAGQVEDVDVAPDGTIWALADSGRLAAHLRADGSLIGVESLGQYPYGEQVRVAPDGVAWVTMSYDRQFAATVTDAGAQAVPGAPPCQGPLGEAGDGSMWCSNNGTLFHLPSSAGIPVGDGASWPQGIAAGPVGDIWFASSTSGTFATSPSDGAVGYLRGATPTRFDTGDRTGPQDIVRGPDGAMWFTSVGAAKGIGHVDPAGRGALTQVGGYEPEYLTFGADGAVWFTDETNNVIVRVPTAELQTTNVDPGAGSIFRQGAGAVPVKVVGPKKVRTRGGRVPVSLTCPKGTKGGCKGKLSLVTAAPVKVGRGKKATEKVVRISAPASFRLKAGKRAVVRPKVTAKGARALRSKPTAVSVLVGGTPIGTIKVRR